MRTRPKYRRIFIIILCTTLIVHMLFSPHSWEIFTCCMNVAIRLYGCVCQWLIWSRRVPFVMRKGICKTSTTLYSFKVSVKTCRTHKRGLHSIDIDILSEMCDEHKPTAYSWINKKTFLRNSRWLARIVGCAVNFSDFSLLMVEGLQAYD